MERGSKMSAPSTSGLSVELLLRVIDVKYGYFTLSGGACLVPPWTESCHVKTLCFSLVEASLVDAMELEERQSETPESTVKKKKLMRGMKKRIRELEDKLWEYEQSQADASSINVITPPTEDQIVESEKYQNTLKERETLEKEKIQLEVESKKINSELQLLRKLVSQRNIDKEAEWDMINEKMNEIGAEKNQLENEKNRLRRELISMASVASDMHNAEELLRTNPDESAYVMQAQSLKKANNVLQNELHDLLKKEEDLKKANEKLWMEKADLQRVTVLFFA